jgi:hypothetical protein
MTTIFGYPQNSTVNKLITNEVQSLDETAKIELGENDIDLIASNVLINGAPISGGGGDVTNPLSSNLDIGNYDIIGVGIGGLETLNGISNTVSLQGSNILNNQNNITDLENKTVSIDPITTLGYTKINGILETTSQTESTHFVSNSSTNTNVFKGTTNIDSLNITDTNPILRKINLNQGDILDVKNIDLKTLNVNTNDNIVLNGNLDFQNTYQLLNVDTINNIRPSGGVFSESGETAYIGGAGGGIQSIVNQDPSASGSLMIPAGGFVVGDTYSFKIGGRVTCNNNDSFEIDILSNYNLPSQTTLAQINIISDGGQVDNWFEIEFEFIVRATGTMGKISSNGNYSYFNSNNFMKGIGVDVLVNIDTTINNQLDVLFVTIDNSISLTVSQVSLTKLY